MDPQQADNILQSATDLTGRTFPDYRIIKLAVIPNSSKMTASLNVNGVDYVVFNSPSHLLVGHPVGNTVSCLNSQCI
jgi:hypothetical protein